jgi:phosphomecalonate degydratase small subunit
MKMKGRVINGGSASGEALVLDVPFSFIGDFDPDTGKITILNHPLFGKSLANKILVCPTGKGGTIAPFIAYQAKKKGNAPAAILCKKVEPILCESALAINIPILDSLSKDPVEHIKTGQFISIENDEVSVAE